MSKLLRANMHRLVKNNIFIVSNIGMFIFGLYSVFAIYQDNSSLLHDGTPDKAFGGYIIPMCILLTFFCCDFIGEEFDGTIRNKLTVGNTRFQVYAAQNISCFFAGLLMSISYLLPAILVGEIVLGGFTTDIIHLTIYFVCGLVLTLACSSIFCLTMTIAAKKNTGTALSVFLVLIIMFIGQQTKITLELPATTFHPSIVDNELVGAYIDNPLYPTGLYRTFLEYLYDFMPSTQSYQITYFSQNVVSIEHALTLACFSLLLAIVAFGIGGIIFGHKDLK